MRSNGSSDACCCAVDPPPDCQLCCGLNFRVWWIDTTDGTIGNGIAHSTPYLTSGGSNYVGAIFLDNMSTGDPCTWVVTTVGAGGAYAADSATFSLVSFSGVLNWVITYLLSDGVTVGFQFRTPVISGQCPSLEAGEWIQVSSAMDQSPLVWGIKPTVNGISDACRQAGVNGTGPSSVSLNLFNLTAGLGITRTTPPGPAWPTGTLTALPVTLAIQTGLLSPSGENGVGGSVSDADWWFLANVCLPATIGGVAGNYLFDIVLEPSVDLAGLGGGHAISLYRGGDVVPGTIDTANVVAGTSSTFLADFPRLSYNPLGNFTALNGGFGGSTTSGQGPPETSYAVIA